MPSSSTGGTRTWWVERRFGSEGAKVFLELGPHYGSDTAWMAALEGVRIHAVEPDPRNHQVARANVIQHRAAIADRDGRAPFILSQHGWGQEWTHSSSLKTPKNHLSRFPVTFGETDQTGSACSLCDALLRADGFVDFEGTSLGLAAVPSTERPIWFANGRFRHNWGKKFLSSRTCPASVSVHF